MKPSRASSIAIGILAALIAGFALSLMDAARLRNEREAGVFACRTLTERFGLTDVALFTEARYTRHPTQADLNSAFQDHPFAFEHFPSGSLLPPPQHDLLDRTPARAD